MTDEVSSTIKELLDKAGLNVSLEQIETSLATVDEQVPGDESQVNEIMRKIKAKANEKEVAGNEGYSLNGTGECYAVSGQIDLEYNGRGHKKYQGNAVLLVKPDDSLVVHGMHGVNPVSYIARAEEVRFGSKDGKLTVMAIAGSDRLIVTFLKVSTFESLIGKVDQEIKRPERRPADHQDKLIGAEAVLTEEEKSLEARLRKLRIDLAHREGISFLPAVYDNSSMHQLIRMRPKNLEELMQIKGFGAKRIERYADDILKTINGTGEQISA